MPYLSCLKCRLFALVYETGFEELQSVYLTVAQVLRTVSAATGSVVHYKLLTDFLII